MAFPLSNVLSRIFQPNWNAEQANLHERNKRTVPSFVMSAPDARLVDAGATGVDRFGPGVADRWLTPRSAAVFTAETGPTAVLTTSLSQRRFAVEGLNCGVTCQQQMSLASNSHLGYTVRLSTDRFPDHQTVKHAVKVAVHQMMWQRGLPRWYREPLIDAMTRDMVASLHQAARRGCFDRGIEFSASYQLIRGGALEGASQQAVAVREQSMLRQGALPRIVSAGPSLVHARKVFATMDELRLKAHEGTLTMADVSNYFYRHRRDEWAVQGLTSRQEPMYELTTAASAFARNLLDPRRSGKNRSARPASTFDAEHVSLARQPLPGSPLHDFMRDFASTWKPTHDPKELAFRFVHLMTAYERQAAYHGGAPVPRPAAGFTPRPLPSLPSEGSPSSISSRGSSADSFAGSFADSFDDEADDLGAAPHHYESIREASESPADAWPRVPASTWKEGDPLVDSVRL